MLVDGFPILLQIDV